jgi:hypothetical protein
MILDLSRTRGPVIALIGTAIALGCYGTLINTALGRHNKWLLERDQTTAEADSIELGAGRALGILRERAAVGTGAGERLGVLVGASVLKTGINPSLLTSEIGGGYRWANLVTTGYPFDFSLMIRYIYRYNLNPDALVLVMHPSALAPRANIRQEHVFNDPNTLVKHAIKFEVPQARQDMIAISLVPWKLALPYRGHIYSLAGRSLFAAKHFMFDLLGMGLEGLYEPAANPWCEDHAKIKSPRLTTDETKRGYLKKLENLGWFDPNGYRSDGPNFAFLVEIFRRTHARGTRSFIVFVPESRLFRANLPPDDDYHFTHTLMETLGPAAPLVLNFRDFAPDEEFHDLVHLNEVGLSHFTRGLADRLKPYLENGNPARELVRQ